jgi:serine/threonine-protein kinase OSR1/STK39
MFPSDASQYTLLSHIGTGASGDVYHAKCNATNRHLALKIIDLDRESSDLNTVRQEVAFWSSCDHPNIVPYYRSFVSGPYLYIAMEYLAAGSVSGILRDSFRGGFPCESVIASVLRAVARALAHIHAHGQIHRDVKPGNIIVGQDGSVKLGDFGVAATLLEDGQRRRARFSSTGTPCYMAPEVVSGSIGHTEKADIWSLGITAIELAVGAAPYAGMTIGAILPKLMKAPPPQLPRKGSFSFEFRDFVRKCMNADPRKRMSAVELLAHPFLTQEHIGPSVLVESVIKGLAPLSQRYQKRVAGVMSQFVMSDAGLRAEKTSSSKIEWFFQTEDAIQKGRFRIRKVRRASWVGGKVA